LSVVKEIFTASQPNQLTVDLPGPNDRLTIVGRTGTGKTLAATYHLSNADFDRKPWIVYDFKREKLFSQISRAREIAIGEIPKHPGVYVVRPNMLEGTDEAIEGHLMGIWEHENVGLYIDEGYMIGQRSAGLRAIYTQGRSKHIPVITLSQQPVWVSRFAISEADFYQVFDLNDTMHQKVIRRFVPIDEFGKLKPYHSYYYDVGNNTLIEMKPVPPASELVGRIDDRLKLQVNRRYI
jgi:hypothetical protein